MIQLGAEHLLQLVLAIESAAMAIVAGIFLLLLRVSRPGRGRWWFLGWALFAFTLFAEALGQRNIQIQDAMSYVGTVLAIAAGYCGVAGVFDFREKPSVPLWANALTGAGGVAALIVAWRSELTANLLAPEVTLGVAMLTMALALVPLLRSRQHTGAWPTFFAAVLLTLMIARTLGVSAYLAPQHAQLNALYWSAEVIGGVILAIMLAMGELIMLVDEVRFDVEEANAALSRALESLEVAAKVDALTGLHNRYAFYTLTDGLRSQPDRGNIVLLDLNDLKRINDTYGHFNGDRALLNVAQRLRELVGARDYVFRWGGDEFVLLFFGVPLEEARNRVAHMRSPAPLDVTEQAQPVPLSVSWGIAPFNPLDIDGSLRQADAHLYAQKRLIRKAFESPKPRTEQRND